VEVKINKAAFEVKKKEIRAKSTGLTKVVVAKKLAQKALLSMLQRFRVCVNASKVCANDYIS
jgi:hypothetical protein